MRLSLGGFGCGKGTVKLLGASSFTSFPLSHLVKDCSGSHYIQSILVLCLCFYVEVIIPPHGIEAVTGVVWSSFSLYKL